MVANALHALSDSLGEYNAITLFSHPEMQGTRDQKAFFRALADKYLLKARLARDEVSTELRRRHERSSEDQLTSSGKLFHYKH